MQCQIISGKLHRIACFYVYCFIFSCHKQTCCAQCLFVAKFYGIAPVQKHCWSFALGWVSWRNGANQHANSKMFETDKRMLGCLLDYIYPICASSSGPKFTWKLWLLCFSSRFDLQFDATAFHFLFWLRCFFVDMYGMSPSSWVGTSWATSLTSKPYQTTCCFRLRPSFFSNFHGAQQTLCSKTLWWPHAEHDGGAGHEVFWVPGNMLELPGLNLIFCAEQ